MTWKPPATELEWEECLSAYLDDELERDTAAALEAHLEHDAVRAAQLEALRKTSALLQTWTVDAPPPDDVLRAKMAKNRVSKRLGEGTALRFRGTWRLAAAFAMGVIAGAWMMGWQRTPPPNPEVRVVEQSPSTESTSTVPQAQANVVFKEVEAAALTQRIRQAAREGRWKNALEGLERMDTQYAGTEAAHDFAKEPVARRIFQRSLRGRS